MWISTIHNVHASISFQVVLTSGKIQAKQKSHYFIIFLISQGVLDISMKVFSQMAMVWTLLLATLFWIMTLYRNLGLISFHQHKTFQIQFSILVTVMMGTREEYHIYSWHLDNLWIMILLMSYILQVHLVDVDAGIW